MKRTWRILLLTAAVIALLCVVVCAADAEMTAATGVTSVSNITHYSTYSEAAPESNVSVGTKTDNYYKDTVAMGFTYTDATNGTSGKLAIVIVSTADSATNVNVNNILYINLYTFTPTGTIAPVVYPKNVSKSYVYVSYSGLSGLTQIAQIKVNYILGNVDDSTTDPVININDVIRLARYVARIDGVTLNMQAADVNSSGGIDINDVIRLARYVAKIDGVVLG